MSKVPLDPSLSPFCSLNPPTRILLRGSMKFILGGAFVLREATVKTGMVWAGPQPEDLFLWPEGQEDLCSEAEKQQTIGVDFG